MWRRRFIERVSVGTFSGDFPHSAISKRDIFFMKVSRGGPPHVIVSHGNCLTCLFNVLSFDKIDSACSERSSEEKGARLSKFEGVLVSVYKEAIVYIESKIVVEDNI